jgi:hypothetical protein
MEEVKEKLWGFAVNTTTGLTLVQVSRRRHSWRP